MEHSLGSSGNLTIDNDPDRFYVRIPAAESLGTVSINLATTVNPDPNYNDDPTAITLEPDPDSNGLRTKSLLLVSNDMDDVYFLQGEIEQDDAPNDRTHEVQLEGKVAITGITAERHHSLHEPYDWG